MFSSTSSASWPIMINSLLPAYIPGRSIPFIPFEGDSDRKDHFANLCNSFLNPVCSPSCLLQSLLPHVPLILLFLLISTVTVQVTWFIISNHNSSQQNHSWLKLVSVVIYNEWQMKWKRYIPNTFSEASAQSFMPLFPTLSLDEES